MERLIEGTTRLRASAERAMRVMCVHEDVVLGISPLAASRHRELGLGPVHHEIALHLGAPVEDPGRVVRPVRWEAAMHAELFPVFDGEIGVERDEDGQAVLRLSGVYRAPFGAVGSFGDGVAGRRVARRCVAGFVEDIARRLEDAAEPLVQADDPPTHEVRVTDSRAAVPARAG